MKISGVVVEIEGTYKTKAIWTKDGAIWSHEGILQPKSVAILFVPKQIAAARI